MLRMKTALCPQLAGSTPRHQPTSVHKYLALRPTNSCARQCSRSLVHTRPRASRSRAFRGKPTPITLTRASKNTQDPVIADNAVRTFLKSTFSSAKSPLPDGDDDNEGKQKWQVFNLSLYATPWDVPWGWGNIVWAIVGWAASFVITGALIVPLTFEAFGIRLSDLNTDQQSFYVLAAQFAETVVGLGVISLAVRKYRPLSEDFFQFDFRRPFTAPNGWAAWGVLGYLSSFGVVGIATTLCFVLGYNQTDGGGTIDSVVPLVNSGNPLDLLSLLLVTSVLAPILEESLFRGFLLTSLTRYMPNSGAVVISSLVFALAHFTPKDAPQLFALGLVLGTLYTRTRNLLTPVMVHALWNSGVLLLFVLLQTQGYDLSEMLEPSAASATMHLPMHLPIHLHTVADTGQ